MHEDVAFFVPIGHFNTMPLQLGRLDENLLRCKHKAVLNPCGTVNQSSIRLAEELDVDLLFPYLPLSSNEEQVSWQVIWEPTPNVDENDMACLVDAMIRSRSASIDEYVTRIYFGHGFISNTKLCHLRKRSFTLVVYPSDTLFISADPMMVMGLPHGSILQIHIMHNETHARWIIPSSPRVELVAHKIAPSANEQKMRVRWRF